MSRFLLLHEVHDHSGVQMQQSQHHGPVKDHLAVMHRGEEVRKPFPGAVRMEDMLDLIGYVAEEGACKCPHHKGGDTAPQKQLYKRQRVLAGFQFRHSHNRCSDHDEAVTHVRHHQPEEQDEEGGHQRVRIHRAVLRKAVHVGDHIQAVGKEIVFEFDRNFRILRLDGLFRLPGAVERGKDCFQFRLALRGDPSFHQEDVLRSDLCLFRLRHRNAGVQLVCCQLQFLPVLRSGCDHIETLRLAGPERIELGFGQIDAVFRRSLQFAEVHGIEREGPERFLRGAGLFFQADHRKIPPGTVAADLESLAFIRFPGQPFVDRFHGNLQRDRSKQDLCALGERLFQTQIHRRPRLERLDQAALPALLRTDPFCLVIRGDHLFCASQCCLDTGIIQEDVRRNFGLRGKQR